MRLSGKEVIERDLGNSRYIGADFTKSEFDGLIKDKGYWVIHEKNYLCPCKSRESAARNTCRNCGGTGFIFANPTRTKMIITGISADPKMKEGALAKWGQMDTGNVKITAYNEDKLTYLDRITVLDATAEHNQILYPQMLDDNSQRFVYTKYDILGIDYIAMFQTESTVLKRLVEGTDYTFRDNVVVFNASYNAAVDPCVTIRYIHNPSYHIVDILRESITSTTNEGNTKMILPIHAMGRRAHLVADVENYIGNRLLDNSWKPIACESPDMTKFQRMLRYTSSQDIFDNLTTTQKAELLALLDV